LGLALAAENVQVKKYFDPPLHRQRLYKRFHNLDGKALAVTESISHSVLSLPIYAGLTDDAVDHLVEAVERIHTYRFEVAAGLRCELQAAGAGMAR
jgi:dTDP-4-amino-4,6-dideoxygalactose transaminase